MFHQPLRGVEKNLRHALSVGMANKVLRPSERIPQKSIGPCDQSSPQLFDLARFLIARPISFEGQALTYSLTPSRRRKEGDRAGRSRRGQETAWVAGWAMLPRCKRRAFATLCINGVYCGVVQLQQLKTFIPRKHEPGFTTPEYRCYTIPGETVETERSTRFVSVCGDSGRTEAADVLGARWRILVRAAST